MPPNSNYGRSRKTPQKRRSSLNMPKYKIEHQVETLSQNAIMDDESKPASFSREGIRFAHKDFNIRDGWQRGFWIATFEIEVSNYKGVLPIFLPKLRKILRRVSLISQSYTEFANQPFLITKEGSDFAFFRYTADSNAVGLMFMEKELKALDLLLETNQIPEAFYSYWKDSVNTIGYTSKLLTMLSAVEALVRTGKRKKKDWKKMKEILGIDLVEDLFGTKENSTRGLRHRLIHGEYFDEGDWKKDYFEMVHRKVITYFNDKIFKEKLISENVRFPQRHPYGNKRESRFFIEAIVPRTKFGLKNVLRDASQNGIREMKKYRFVPSSVLAENY